MAAVEVASATSAFQAEKVEEPIKNHELESNTVKETETESPEPVKETETASPESTPEEPVKETDTAAAEPAGADAEAEALTADVQAKVVVEETDVNLPEEPVGGDTAKVAPEPRAEPEPTAGEMTKEAEQETKVNAVEAEPADSKADSEEAKPAGEVEEEKVEDEAEAEEEAATKKLV